MDRGFSCNSERTRQGSIKNYIDLYSGPEFALNSRYSAILLMISVTAFFGGSLPLLYPIGVLAFLTMIVTEKLSLAYFYREPPMYDESITKSSNSVIKVILYIGLFLTSWQLGNRQIFEKETGTLVLATDVPHSHHSLKEFLSQANPLHMTYNSAPIVLLEILLAY